MSRTRILVSSGLGIASLAALGVGGRLLLTRQAAIARRRIGKPLGEESIDADRVWRRSLAGKPAELLLLGDSLAAGLGAERRKDTLGGRLSKGLARQLGRPVRLRTVAQVGSESSALATQLDSLPPGYRPDAAVIVVGGNDVTHRVPIAESVAHLKAAIERLRQRGAVAIVGTCPDLGALRPVPQPLRTLGARLSWQLAAAQAAAAADAGAVSVDLRRAVGPIFVDDPDGMFSLDRFHPSALGYRRTAEALLPALAELVRPTVGVPGQNVRDLAPGDDS
ncbi:MAG TPA: SGNH/GDSL hydrolase family protein [Candidatus Agrococcus pullicola]|uniref:SGNH/GDSL hydrolase family protein n=1 Tax=Candidatus Agrococcus pullicola TaxID=2838429 RepID=A0A9D1YSQ1_9MICO|nr:SGNH/GDSL hydrolase family protein [Candidatus Agrococcus pullicola]